MSNLIHRDELLRQIATKLSNLSTNVRLFSIKVIFHAPDSSYEFGLRLALEVIANDLYWDERGNWSRADRISIEIF